MEGSPDSRVVKSDDERIVIAEVVRPRGNKGELLVMSQTDVPGRLEELKVARLRLPDGSDKELPIESAWVHKGAWVLKFAGVDTISEAEMLAGAEIWIARADRGELPDGRYFQSDLIGSIVIDLTNNQELGIVLNYQDYGGAPLLEIEHAGRSVLIPLVPEICKVVDVVAKRIEVELPDGLLDL